LLAFVLSLALAQVTPEPTPAASPTSSPSAAPLPGAALGVSPVNIDLNPAQQRTIAVTGAAAPLQVTLDKRLVTATASADATTVTVTATQATGDDVLHVVDANGAQADVPVRVAFNAGTIVAQTTLKVTGEPVDPDWLAQQVAASVARLTQAQPGARTTIGTVTQSATPLQPGSAAQFVVPVQISGNGQYFDQSGSTTVSVQNVALDRFAPEVLFYDDDPEHVTQDGVFFRGSVSAGRPTRLYYYHDNTQDPRRLVLALRANSQDPTQVQVVDATAGPNADVMHVGHTVTQKYLLAKQRGEALILDLIDSPYFLQDITMGARDLVAGSVDFRVLSGGPVIVTVLSVSPGVDPRALLDGAVLPGDGHHRTGTFALSGFGSHSLSYSVGGPDVSLDIGDTQPTPPSADPAATGHDYGDYGVLHTIDLTLTNPSGAAATAYLYFKPSGNPARGGFLVDGNFVSVGCVRVPQPYQISVFDLTAGQTQHTVVQTMTDGGSFLPVQIGVSTTPPQPAAPPITAPDGCFPKPAAGSQ
jgi:hypothetical protein